MDLKLFWRALQRTRRSCFLDHLQVGYIILELSYNFLKVPGRERSRTPPRKINEFEINEKGIFREKTPQSNNILIFPTKAI